MPKSRAGDGAPQRRRLRSVHLTNTVEGQITELCRDLAVAVKRMRQLQEQADELRTVIHQSVAQSEPDSEPEPAASRAGRR